MRRAYRGAVILAAASYLPLFSIEAPSTFSGRWDLTISLRPGKTPADPSSQRTYPSWIEFADEGGTPAIRLVGRFGSVHPVRNAQVNGSHLTFEDPASGRWQMAIQNRKLTGVTADGRFEGIPAPALKHKPPAAWTSPEPLLVDQGGLSGWEPDNPAANHWILSNGVLENLQAGANIRTTRNFADFQLHIEYNCPRGGNSGVYLRGRYEVQVEYEPIAKNDAFHRMGSIYGFVPPAHEMEPRPGEWESYDVTLLGRYVTVFRNKVLIVDNAEIPGITGGALDSREGEPGPLYLQGDHTGGLKYRNITISVPR